jgi:hypothetical protein
MWLLTQACMAFILLSGAIIPGLALETSQLTKHFRQDPRKPDWWAYAPEKEQDTTSFGLLFLAVASLCFLWL